MEQDLKWWQDTCNYWREQCYETRQQLHMYADLAEIHRKRADELESQLEAIEKGL